MLAVGSRDLATLYSAATLLWDLDQWRGHKTGQDGAGSLPVLEITKVNVPALRKKCQDFPELI